MPASHIRTPEAETCDLFSGTAAKLRVVILFLLSTGNCLAGEEEPVVWVAEGVSISDTRKIALYPVAIATGTKNRLDVSGKITNTIRTELTKAGLSIVEPVEGRKTENIGIQISLVHYQPGDVGGRWIGLGGGAAICIIRANIIDETSKRIIGDIIVTELVDGGGLFGIGAEKYVSERAARKMAEQLAGLFGIELKPGEVSE